MTRLRLVSLNTWKGDGAYSRRLDAMSRELVALAPDVLFLQEALRAPDADHDTSARLAADLGHHCIHAETRAKPRWVEGKLLDSTSGVAILSRTPLEMVEIVDLPTSEADGGRCALTASLRHAGRVLDLACVHLSHLRGSEGADLRERQLSSVLSALDARDAARGASDARIVAGDLNALRTDAELRPLASDPAADWGGAEFLSRATRLAVHPGGVNVPGAIDHIVVRDPGGALRVRSRRLALNTGGIDPANGQPPSDHAAVVCDIAAAA
ncbi:hypothetical protein GC169_01840 [bacterium]|nr:hypothetical protein [bacterium]